MAVWLMFFFLKSLGSSIYVWEKFGPERGERNLGPERIKRKKKRGREGEKIFQPKTKKKIK